MMTIETDSSSRPMLASMIDVGVPQHGSGQPPPLLWPCHVSAMTFGVSSFCSGEHSSTRKTSEAEAIEAAMRFGISSSIWPSAGKGQRDEFVKMTTRWLSEHCAAHTCCEAHLLHREKVGCAGAANVLGSGMAVRQDPPDRDAFSTLAAQLQAARPGAAACLLPPQIAKKKREYSRW